MGRLSKASFDAVVVQDTGESDRIKVSRHGRAGIQLSAVRVVPQKSSSLSYSSARVEHTAYTSKRILLSCSH